MARNDSLEQLKRREEIKLQVEDHDVDNLYRPCAEVRTVPNTGQ